MKSLALLLLVAACGSVGSSSTADDPTLTAVEPARGPAGGGTTITVQGTNFVEGEAIALVGDALATDTRVVSATELTFTLPPGDEGAIAEVTVGTSRGFATLPGAFTYSRRPVVLSVSPTAGARAGGTAITITGRGFAESGTVPEIRVGGVAATSVQVVDDRTLTAVVAPAAAETAPFVPVDVEVDDLNGLVVLPEAFVLTAPGLVAVENAGQSARVHFLDPATGTLQLISTVPHHMTACATKGAQLYGTGRSSVGLDELFTFDAIAGRATPIGALRDAGTVPHGPSTITFVGEKLYGIDSSRRGAQTMRLMEINLTTGQTTLIGTALAVGRPVAITPRDATSVYLVDRTDETLDSVSVTTGALVPGVPISKGSPSTVHALANHAGSLYLYEQQTGQLRQMNPATGALAQPVLTRFSVRALCPTPEGW